MSASSKKKLRKENAAALLTEKQKQEQAEAKKLKTISIAFVALMLVVAITAASILVVRGVNNSGVLERNTIAAVINGEELNSVQMNYYLNDYIRNIYTQMKNTYGDSTAMYLSAYGLDVNKPLNEQMRDEKTGETWGDFYLAEALKKAKSDYALYAKAMAEDFKLSEEEQNSLDSAAQTMELYATIYGYKSADKYLEALYGFGSDVESYARYSKIATIASAYYNKHQESLKYDDATIREYEKDKKNDYTSFSYAVYALSTSSFLEGGTKNESTGAVTYTDAEKEAARAKAEEIANNLAKSADLAELDKAIAALEINKDNDKAAATRYTDYLYTDISEILQSWLVDEKRVENEMTVIPNEVTSTDADGKETKTTNGYYVVVFQSRNENLRHLANVRHLLVKFKGGKTGTDGNITYSDAEKAEAKAEAERLLQVWKDGKATEETFISMVKAYTDDTASAENGGLYEDIHPKSNYVETFRNWSIDTDRKPGDTAVLISDYGYHIMFYSSDDELTYRDYMIQEDLRAKDQEEWSKAIVDAATAKIEKTNRLNLDIVLAYM